jgi:hypothetical protein
VSINPKSTGEHEATAQSCPPQITAGIPGIHQHMSQSVRYGDQTIYGFGDKVYLAVEGHLLNLGYGLLAVQHGWQRTSPAQDGEHSHHQAMRLDGLASTAAVVSTHTFHGFASLTLNMLFRSGVIEYGEGHHLSPLGASPLPLSVGTLALMLRLNLGREFMPEAGQPELG